MIAETLKKSSGPPAGNRDESGSLDWPVMVGIEPRLAGLARWAACGGSWRTWANITSTLRTLVGWHAARPELRSCDAYELAYGKLLAAFERRKGRRRR
jgi:hypothetical protein